MSEAQLEALPDAERQPPLKGKSRTLRLSRRVDDALHDLAAMWGVDLNGAISVAIAEACRNRDLL